MWVGEAGVTVCDVGLVVVHIFLSRTNTSLFSWDVFIGICGLVLVCVCLPLRSRSVGQAGALSFCGLVFFSV